VKVEVKKGALRGEAILQVSELSPEIADEGVEFAISGGGKFLSPAGWQISNVTLKPERVEASSGGALLFVGPDVVDNMLNANYKFQLYKYGAVVGEVIFRWADIPHSPGFGRNAGQVRVGKEEPVSVVRPSPAPPSPTLKPEPEPDPVPPAPATDIDDDSRKTEVARAGDGKNKRGVLIAALSLVLLVVGGAVWWMVGEKSTPVIEGKVNNSSQPLSPLDLAKKAIRDGVDPKQAVDMALQQLGVLGGSEAAFLLIEYAAKKDHKDAMFVLGQIFDPWSARIDFGPIRKDAETALGWYIKARSAGHPDAGQQIARFKDMAQQKAADGNREAVKLLSNTSAW
jgi:hypothetical protein